MSLITRSLVTPATAPWWKQSAQEIICIADNGQTNINIGGVRSAITFSVELSLEQTRIVAGQMKSDRLIPSHYDTWQQFCAAHGVIEPR